MGDQLMECVFFSAELYELVFEMSGKYVRDDSIAGSVSLT